MTKRKELFIGLNALLAIIVGVIIGLACSDVFARPVGTFAFVTFIIALCLPSVVFLVSEKLNFGFTIIGVLFIASELIVSILFMIYADWEMKSFGISQACMVGALIATTMIDVCIIPKKED